MKRRLIALALSIPLAAAGGASIVLHVCQAMGGVAGVDCECEREAHGEAHADRGHAHGDSHCHTSSLKLEPQPCCSVEVTSRSATVATFEALAIEVEAPASAFVAVSQPRVPCSRITDPVDLLRERAPPAERGPPLFIRHCSLLN